MDLKFELVSSFPVLLGAASRLFRQQPALLQGRVSLVERGENPKEFVLRHALDFPVELLREVTRLLLVLSLEVVPDPALPEGYLSLRMGTSEEEPFKDVNVQLKVNQQPLHEVLDEEFSQLSGLSMPARLSPVRRSRILFGGASSFARRAAQLVLLSHGVEVRPKREWDPSDMDLFVHVCAPGVASRPAVEHNPVRVYTDDPAAAEVALGRLLAAGVPLEMLPLTELSGVQSEALGMGMDMPPPHLRRRNRLSPERFGTALGGLSQEYGEQSTLIQNLFEEALRELGVPLEEMPIENISPESDQPFLVFPVGAFRAGALRPYSARHAFRFAVQLEGDDHAVLEPIRARLRDLGFSAVHIAPPEGAVGRRPRVHLPGIFWPNSATDEEVQTPLRRVIQDALREHTELDVNAEERQEEVAADTIRIVLPLSKLRAEGLDGLLRRQAASLDVQIFAPNTSGTQAVVQELRRRGFRKVRVAGERGRRRTGIFYGQAASALMTPLARWFSEQFSEDLPAEKIWGSHDDDVHIWLPETISGGAVLDGRRSSVLPGVAMDAWVYGEDRIEERPFLIRTPQELQVGELRLPRPERGVHPRIPALAELGHYVLDETTAATLRLLASAVALREPCLLEGETSTSKTSVILFLAAHLGQPVLRMNLNGQTDTSELIGRHVPAAGGASPWRWQDGLVVEAMLQGYWLILDELNLAEPQVLERLNSVLEREPSLVLSEHDGRVLGTAQVHRDFRIFATMNPATYAGRSPLSPAFRDRFRAYRRVPVPSEQDVLVFLRTTVTGAGSSIQVAGRRYTGDSGPPTYPALAAHPWLVTALPALARFHASVCSAFSVPSGPSARERYAFTRRALLSLLDFLAAGEVSETRLREALVRYYIERVLHEDRPTVIRLLDAAGIGPGTWSPGALPARSSAPPDEGDTADPDLEALLAEVDGL